MLVRRAQAGGKTPVETTYPEYRDVRDGASAFSGLAAVPSTIQPAVRTDGMANEPLAVVGASGNLFDVLGARPLLGRTLTPDTIAAVRRPSSCSAGMWERQFGDGDRFWDDVWT
jgi:hypothetical protein